MRARSAIRWLAVAAGVSLAAPTGARAERVVDDPFDDPGLEPEREAYSARLRARVEQAARDEAWDRVVALTDEGIRVAPSDAALIGARERALRERAAAADYQRVLALSGRNPVASLKAFDRLPANSMYRAKAEPLAARLRQSLVGSKLAKARRLLRAHCAEVTKQARAVLDVAPDDDEAHRLLDLCRETTLVARAPVAAPAHGSFGHRLRDLKDPFVDQRVYEQPDLWPPAESSPPRRAPSAPAVPLRDLRDPFADE